MRPCQGSLICCGFIGVRRRRAPCQDLRERLLECLFETEELFPYALALVIIGLGLYFVAGMVYRLVYDPDGVNVASRLDVLSIDPEKWFPRS